MKEVMTLLSTDVIIAQRIQFVREVPTGKQVLTEFTEPEPYFAVVEPLSVEDLLTIGNTSGLEDGFYFLFLRQDSPEAMKWQKQAEEWIAMPAMGTTQPTVELFVKYDRILWRPGKIVVQGTINQLEQIVPAIVEFAFYENELRRLELEVHTNLKNAKTDVHLTHGVEKADLKKQPHVNEMTYHATLARMRFACLEPFLEMSSTDLIGQARRLCFEMFNQANVPDRLEIVDDQLEVVQDLYEVANDRLTEFRYYRNESTLELWVIFILALEVVLIIVELFKL